VVGLVPLSGIEASVEGAASMMIMDENRVFAMILEQAQTKVNHSAYIILKYHLTDICCSFVGGIGSRAFDAYGNANSNSFSSFDDLSEFRIRCVCLHGN